MTANHYEVLGVSPQADLAEIKKARLRLIREFTPERRPERFMAIELAYKTLSDPDLRADYDANQAYGEQLSPLLSEAEALMTAGKWIEALNPLKQALILHPKSEKARSWLAICLINAERWEDAKKAYARLVEQDGNSIDSWTGYGRVFILEANSLDIEAKADRSRLAREARARLEKARLLDPGEPSIHILFARSYAAECNYKRAIMEIQSAIRAARGAVDPDHFLYMAWMHIFDGSKDGVAKVADQLKAALPNHEEGCRYPAAVFAKAAIESFKAHHFHVALPFIVAAARINPADQTISQIKTNWDQAQESFDEYNRMKEDTLVTPPLRALLATLCDEIRNLELDVPREELLERILEALKSYDPAQTAASAQWVRQRYPALHRLNPKLIDDLAQGLSPQSPPTTDNTNALLDLALRSFANLLERK